MMKNMYRNDEALTIRLNMPGTGKTVTSDPIHIPVFRCVERTVSR